MFAWPVIVTRQDGDESGSLLREWKECGRVTHRYLTKLMDMGGKRLTISGKSGGSVAIIE